MLNWLKRKIAGKELQELFAIQMRIADVWRWCAEFDQMCAGIEYVRNNPRNEHIEAFRERMRREWGVISVLDSAPVRCAGCGRIYPRTSGPGKNVLRSERCTECLADVVGDFDSPVLSRPAPTSTKGPRSAEIAALFAGTDFGGAEKTDIGRRGLLCECILKRAAGYGCGYTITRIGKEAGLLDCEGRPDKDSIRWVLDHLRLTEGLPTLIARVWSRSAS